MLLVWFMGTFLSQYFQITGGAAAYVIVGSLLTLMNLFVRPLLHILTLPLKILTRLAALVIVNGLFVQLTHMIVLRMDPELVSLEIFGGLWGWMVVAFLFGSGNWIAKEMLNRSRRAH